MPREPNDHRHRLTGGDHDHGHDHAHRGGHAALWLARPVSPRAVHRVGRRQFLTELGRNTFAIAVLGGVASSLMAACSDADEDESQTSDDQTTTGEGTAGEATTDDRPPPSSDAADPTRLRWAQASLGSVSAYVLVRGNQAAVVDTGNPGSTDDIGRALATLGVTFDDVRHVVLTHSHPDHIGSLADVLDTAPSAIPYAGALDIPNITAPVDVTAVGDGDEVFGLRVIDTPGHTPGSISLLDPGIGLLLAGDALNGNDDGTALTGPNERFTPDMGTANRSVAKLAGYEVEAVGMGHGQPMTTDAGSALLSLVDQLVASGDVSYEASFDSSSESSSE
jgi:glyoxylase-like metal-dependent hydrolase (beta-lactamase superfamily II)